MIIANGNVAHLFYVGDVKGHQFKDFDFKAELDLQGNSLGAATGLLARANEIYINWHKYPGASVRFGQIKAAFGEAGKSCKACHDNFRKE